MNIRPGAEENGLRGVFYAGIDEVSKKNCNFVIPIITDKTTMKEGLSSAWRWTKRYVTLPLLIAVAYIIYILFFNENSYFKSMEYQTEIDRLEAEIKENNDTMLYYHQLNTSLTSDPAELERIVREEYHMQRPNEDVYVFE
jgi:cell division protein FtsB